jgi:hypothetical protein
MRSVSRASFSPVASTTSATSSPGHAIPRLTPAASPGAGRRRSQTKSTRNTQSEGEAFTSGLNWSTAWAVDSGHAADLTFSFTVQNTGTDCAREITGMVFNVYLGQNWDLIESYEAWEHFPDGKLQNVFPGNSFTFDSSAIGLTMDEMRRIDLGEPLFVTVEYFSFGIDQFF